MADFRSILAARLVRNLLALADDELLDMETRAQIDLIESAVPRRRRMDLKKVLGFSDEKVSPSFAELQKKRK